MPIPALGRLSGLSITLCACLLATGCAASSGAKGARAERCAGGDLQLDKVLKRCLVDGLVEPAHIADPEALQLAVNVRAPTTAGGDIGVSSRVVNISDSVVTVDIVTQEIDPAPHPVVTSPDGDRLPNDKDPSCVAWSSSGVVGGLGVSETGQRSVARVTLDPGGSVRADRTVPARNGLCVCAPDETGVLDIRCAQGAGSALAAGTYGVGVSMPLAVERTDGAGAYTFPYARGLVTLTDAPADPWPED
ncbi:MAG: hypothetical protein KDA24_17215 [Deltaproteobacteria bacterium]|nr:hypothetical protein [Deltaproteobacteria bacterium]